MSGTRWYKHNPIDFNRGVARLTLEQIGAYIVILNEIYAAGGPIHNDAGWLARQMGEKTNGPKARGLINSLIAEEKLFLNDEEMLMNHRAEEVISEVDATRDKRQQAGRLGGSKQAEVRRNLVENNNLAEAGLDHIRSKNKEERKSTDNPSDYLVSSPENDDVQTAFDNWNKLAGELGLPAARTLDTRRRSAIAGRLSAGGLDAWNQALAAVKDSPHCRGENDRGWRADLDFVCQAKSFNRLLEGSYATKPKKGLLATIPGGQTEPTDDWGIDDWCRSIGAIPTESESERQRGKWKYGRVIDNTAKQVANAAKFSRKTRIDWSYLQGWVDAGIKTPDIVAAVSRLAEWFASKGDRATNLNSAFDRAVRERRAA